MDAACRRGKGLGSVLGKRRLPPDAHHGGYESLGHGSCSLHGASQHPGPARGVSNGKRPHSGVACAQELFALSRI